MKLQHQRIDFIWIWFSGSLVLLTTKFSQKFKSYFGVCNMIKEKSVDFVLATPQVSKDSHWRYKKDQLHTVSQMQLKSGLCCIYLHTFK